MDLPGADGQPFTYSAPVLADRAVRVIFGRGCLGQVASEARMLGGRIMIISGHHEADAAAGVSDQLGGDLVWRISEVVQHVPVEVAVQAIEAAREARVGVIVSIGGGSATGLAKAVARDAGLPILAVPTTYAGSEMTPIWGQSDQGEKITGRDRRVLPRIVVYDPLLTISMPPGLTAASGMNALAHAVESLYAPDSTAKSSVVAEEAIRALAYGLPRAVRQPDDLNARTETLRGAWLGGWSLGITAMGLHHKLAHVLGGRYQLPHAATHSALLPQVAAFNAPAAPGPFSRAARALGVGGPEAVGQALFELATQLRAPTRLADLGLQADAIQAVGEAVAATRSSTPGTSRRKMSVTWCSRRTWVPRPRKRGTDHHDAGQPTRPTPRDRHRHRPAGQRRVLHPSARPALGEADGQLRCAGHISPVLRRRARAARRACLPSFHGQGSRRVAAVPE